MRSLQRYSSNASGTGSVPEIVGPQSTTAKNARDRQPGRQKILCSPQDQVMESEQIKANQPHNHTQRAGSTEETERYLQRTADSGTTADSDCSHASFQTRQARHRSRTARIRRGRNINHDSISHRSITEFLRSCGSPGANGGNTAAQ